MENSIDGNTWFDYFSSLSKIPDNYRTRINEIENSIKNIFQSLESTNFTSLDFKISQSELQKAIGSLKSGKSPGLDNISNEMLKAAQVFINPCLLKLFNTVFTAGIYPVRWLEGYTTPIFKSENPRLPKNYRGVTICNSIGKLFNIILNKRLDKYLCKNNIIHENQIGFSKKSRTSDHIFVLKCLIDKYINSGNKRLYACFVDFHKAFDTVIHEGIKLKLLQYNINGYFYNILCSMYRYSKIVVKIGNKMTESFEPEIGVKQGDVLSPNIFKIFLNDFSIILDKEQENSVSLSDKKISCLLYADDLVILSDNAEDLQNKLNLLDIYCKDWCLKINTHKTKIIIFNKSGRLLKGDFKIGNENIECVNRCKYLGLIMCSSGSFKETKIMLHNKALKASFKLYKDVKSIDPPVKSLLHLFDHMIKPISIYNSEIWGTLSERKQKKNMDLYDLYQDWEVEKLNMKFCKFILGVNKKSSNIAVLSELGRIPIFYSIIIAMLSYWHRLENISETSLLYCAYLESQLLIDKNINSWYKTITLLSEKLDINLSYYKRLSLNMFKSVVKKRIQANFMQYWYNRRDKDKLSGKLDTYFKFKTSFISENYLNIKSFEYRKVFCKLRISAHNLRIETGRYEKTRDGNGSVKLLERNKRICQLCNLNCIEDELHFLIECPIYNSERQLFFQEVSLSNKNFSSLNSVNKFLWLMSNEDHLLLNNLCKFISVSFENRRKQLSLSKKTSL